MLVGVLVCVGVWVLVLVVVGVWVLVLVLLLVDVGVTPGIELVGVI